MTGDDQLEALASVVARRHELARVRRLRLAGEVGAADVRAAEARLHLALTAAFGPGRRETWSPDVSLAAADVDDLDLGYGWYYEPLRADGEPAGAGGPAGGEPIGAGGAGGGVAPAAASALAVSGRHDAGGHDAGGHDAGGHDAGGHDGRRRRGLPAGGGMVARQPTAGERIVELLADASVAMTPAEVAEALGLPASTATQTLRRLDAAGRVERPERGRYRLPGGAR